MPSANSFIAYVPQLGTRFETFGSVGIHVEMLRDAERSLPFRDALVAAVKAGSRVADIGAGSGILSLWALQAGASHVDAVDNSQVGGILAETFRANGVAEKTTVHVAHSKHVTLAAKADLVVSETLGHIGIDEGILDTCADAKERIAKADATFIPRALDVVAWPVWCPDFETHVSDFWLTQPFGFDLAALRPHARRMTYLAQSRMGQRIAADGVLSRNIIGAPEPDPWHGATTCTAEYPSKCNGFFVSFVADLGNGITCHGERTTSWMVLFLPSPRVIDVKRGEPIALELTIPKTGSVRYSIQHATADAMTVTV